MANNTLSLVTLALIIFAVLFVASGVFVTVWRYLHYHYRSKPDGIEEGMPRPQPTSDNYGQQQVQDCLRSHTPDLTVPHPRGPDTRRKYNTKPLPPVPRPPSQSLHPARPQNPAPVASPPILEQSHFSSDDDDDGNQGHKRKEDKTRQGRAKSWFLPRPLWTRALHQQSPLHVAGTHRVSWRKSQMVASATRFSPQLSQLGRPLAGPCGQSAEVPIMSTPRDLYIAPPLPSSHSLGSPFQNHARRCPDKRDTVVGPGDQRYRRCRDHLQHSLRREMTTGEPAEQADII
ncbi:hypothetical protein LTR51_008682 [Lithohypha guttulata]|nr:hypothetical protein LTR51_008682 [Lithohypha guttulata]